MILYKAIINGRIIAHKIKVADNFFSRMIGLLRHKNLFKGEGLLISPCKQIHTFGMKFEIDVIFLSKEDDIVYIETNIMPGKVSKYIKESCNVLELSRGIVKDLNIKIGNHITFKCQ